MKIKELVKELKYEVLVGNEETDVTTLVYDSRKVEKGSVFVCISGSVRDAHDFIPDVVEKGAAAIIVEKDVELLEHVTVIKWKTAASHWHTCLLHILAIRQRN